MSIVRMLKNKRLFTKIFLFSAVTLLSCIRESKSQIIQKIPKISIPLAGNTWRSTNGKNGGHINGNGIENWSDKNVSFTTYVRVSKPGTIKAWLNLKVPEGKSALQVSVNGVEKEIKAEGAEFKNYYMGEWNVKDTGYIAFHIKGLSKTGNVFANIDSLELSGSAINDKTAFVPNNKGNFFYWGRRGPSVHLNYKVPEDIKVEWLYNEVTVPKGNDVIGSYFMADGFGEGYFVMQVNSPTTRHILFSVWSPYKTNDPKDIPDSLKIQLLAKGENVHAGKFGNEGSGGQSYLNYHWKAGNTYKFLLHGQPDGKGNTIYTAYFYPPEEGKWLLIASFKRPKTDTWLTHLYSFLENFSPAHGDETRKVLFGNQWIRTSQGQWIELNKIKFTTDNTGRKGYRMDYAGGVDGNKFYLKNCGFFDDYTPVDTWFTRPITGKQPDIDLKKLPE